MNKKVKLTDIVDEVDYIFQPFATDDTWERIEKLLLNYAKYIKQDIISDMKNGREQ